MSDWNLSNWNMPKRNIGGCVAVEQVLGVVWNWNMSNWNMHTQTFIWGGYDL